MIIDTAPVLAVADTVPLLGVVDAVLFVARLGVTTRDAAERLGEVVARVPNANVVGVVANDVHDSFLDGGYGGFYSGRYGYGYAATRNGNGKRGGGPPGPVRAPAGRVAASHPIGSRADPGCLRRSTAGQSAVAS